MKSFTQFVNEEHYDHEYMESVLSTWQNVEPTKYIMHLSRTFGAPHELTREHQRYEGDVRER